MKDYAVSIRAVFKGTAYVRARSAKEAEAYVESLSRAEIVDMATDEGEERVTGVHLAQGVYSLDGEAD